MTYAARSSKSLASTLQLLVDKYKDSSKLMLILCGSSMSYMEDHVLAYKVPLYGRRTAQMKILPFYMGKVFEEICKQYLWKLLLVGKSPVEFKELGRWWGTDPSVRSQAEEMGNVALVSYKDILNE